MDVYRKTLLMLDACNLSGLARSFGDEIMPAVWQEVRGRGGGTTEANQHPLVILWTMKMADLAVGECLCERCLDAFGAAYRKVIQKVNGKLNESGETN